MDFSTTLPNDRPFVIAEIGNNHEGRIDAARELVAAAKSCGVDAVKFQAITPRKLVSADQTERLHQLDRLCLDVAELRSLSMYAEDQGLICFSSIFDIDMIDEISSIQNIHKISSGDNTYYDLVRKIGSLNQRCIVSTGGLSFAQMEKVKEIFLSVNKNPANLALLHCVSRYPTDPAEAQLSMIEKMQLRFPEIMIGYSDHTKGIKASIIAASLGARIIEKHFTLDHNYSDFRDHQLSADPIEMKTLVDQLKDIYSYTGRHLHDNQRSDSSMISVRRSAFARTDIAPGDVFCKDNVVWLRSRVEDGVCIDEDIYGKIASKGHPMGTLILL